MHPTYIYLQAMKQSRKESAIQKAYETVLNSYCDVCFIPFNRATPKKIDEGQEILYCSKCHCKTHKCCYDFQAGGTVINEKLSQFLCERCKRDDLKSKNCIACFSSDGALKVINDNQLIHVFCALVHNDIDVVKYYPTLTFKKSLTFEDTSATCEICSNKNAQDHCAQESCKKKVHPYCAKKEYNRLSAEMEEPQSWNFHLSIGNNGNFDLSEEVIPFSLYSDEIEENFKEISDLGLQSEQKQPFKVKKYKEYTDEIRFKRKTTRKLRRGGFLYILCPKHESTMYCFCLTKTEGDMVQCECCLEWYHLACIKSSPKEDQTFVCSFCNGFYDLKKKIIDEVRFGKSDSYELKADLPPKLSLMDLMWLLRVIDHRIAGGLASKMMKELIKYPLKSSSMDLLIKGQHRNKLMALAQDFLIDFLRSQKQIQLLRPRAVLGLDSQGKPITLLKNVEHNHKVRKFIEFAEQIIHRKRVPDPYLGLIAELDFKENALSDSYETIIELSKVEQNYQQVSILKIKAQEFSFLASVKKVNSDQIITFDELQNSIQKAQKMSNLPEYLIRPLIQKYKSVESHIIQLRSLLKNDPDNIYQISAELQTLANLKILPPKEYSEYKMQKNFIHELYLYFVKQEGQKIEEEASINTQIACLINSVNIKPSQELVQIVNTYKPQNNVTIWSGVKNIADKFNKIIVQFEIKDIIKRKSAKLDKFIHLMDKAEEVGIAIESEDIRALLTNWTPIKQKYSNLLTQTMTELNSYETINQYLEKVNELLNLYQEFGLKLEDQKTKKELTWLVKMKKQEGEQLMTLFTESELPKNPLSIQKLNPNLPRNNFLIKNYLSLKKEQSSFLIKYNSFFSKISQKIQAFKADPKKQRKDQIKQNSQKPTLMQITNYIQVLKTSKIDFSKQIKQLTRIMNNSIQIASKVKKYLSQKADIQFLSLQDLSLDRKEIDELRKKVLIHAELNLKTELLELYHAEICNRMRTTLLSPNLQLDKINTLLRFAEEENLTHIETYKTLKERFETKNQKSKEINLIRNYEQQLLAEASKDSTNIYQNLFTLRRTLPLPDIHQHKTKLIYIDELQDKNRELRKKISSILSHKYQKYDFNEAKTVYLECLKSPFHTPELNRFSIQIAKAAEILKKWKELGKAYTNTHPIFSDYDLCLFSIEEIQVVKRELKSIEQDVQKLNFFVHTFKEQNKYKIEQIVENIEQNSIIKDTNLCQIAQFRYLQYWVHLLKYYKENKNGQIPFQKIKKLLIDGYTLLQKKLKKNEEYDSFKPIITALQDYLLAVSQDIKNDKASQNKYLVEGFIDVEDLSYEIESGVDISEEIIILRPFYDISKFKAKNLNRELFNKREDIQSLKRGRSEFKMDDKFDSQKYITLKIDESSDSYLREPENQVPSNVVTDKDRKNIKQIFNKNIRKNLELRKYGDCQNQIKMIQNQIFGEWHNNIIKYYEISEQFQKLFIKLLGCPHMSNKLIKKKFEFKFIQLLVNNISKIDDLQQMIINKLKEQEQEKNQILKVPQLETKKPSQPSVGPEFGSSNNIIELLATGKVDEQAKNEMKKEIKMIKEGKNKKKKHHKTRSRSKSPEAQFSEESQKELPTYIQNQYNNTENDKKFDYAQSLLKKSFGFSEGPLMYDPQQDENAQELNKYPKGSALKLRESQIQLYLKKKGKIQMKVWFYTEEDYKKLTTELVDPGFTKFSVRKEKADVQIIQYINKSKKKYKYLVGWFEAVNDADNQNLRDLSIEANDRHKIFGWQNEHIKLHVMSIRQLVQITKLAPPAKLSSQKVAKYLENQRMVYVIQYPQKVYEIKDSFKSFQIIDKAQKPVTVSIPIPTMLPPPSLQESNYFMKYAMPSLMPSGLPPPSSIKPLSFEDNMMRPEFQTWEQTNISQPITINPPPTINPSRQSTNPYNIIRQNLGFGHFSPIMSDQEDEKQDKNDLASNLLNSIGDITKLPSLPVSRDPKPQYSQNNYYGGSYSYQQQQQQSRPMDSNPQRWSSYPPQQTTAYNPMNPHSSKYAAIPPINPMYKAPMMYPNRPVNPMNPLNPYYGRQGHQSHQSHQGHQSHQLHQGHQGHQGDQQQGNSGYEPRYYPQ